MDYYKPLRPLYSRVGGKHYLKKKILPLFPKNYKDMDYVEPFFGGGSLYFYKIPSKNEVINDLDYRLYTILNMFQKYETEYINKFIVNDYNKESFENIKNSNPTSIFDISIKNFILIKTSFYGSGKRFCLVRASKNTGNNRHIYPIKGDYKKRLQNTIILNQDYINVMCKYNTSNAFFYLDPPYEKSTKSQYDNNIIDYQKLYDTCKSLKGKFLLSINDSQYIRDLFKEFNINEITTKYMNPTTGGYKNNKTIELIITNY